MNTRVWVVQAALLLSLGSGSIAADNQEIKKETKNMAEQTVTTESGLKYLDVTVEPAASRNLAIRPPCITPVGWRMEKSSTVRLTARSRFRFASAPDR